MLYKTRGIVFKYFKYGDTSIIAKVYTEEFGLQSYIVNGARSAKSKGKIAFYQPLTLLNLVVYKKQNSGINRVSEVQCQYPLTTIPYNIIKSSIGVFISELLYKCIKEDDSDPPLFQFLNQSILILDELEDDYHNFHVLFMIKLSNYLGFGISSADEFSYLHNEAIMSSLKQFIASDYNSALIVSNSVRRELLDILLDFYKTHIDSLRELKSMKILKSVLATI